MAVSAVPVPPALSDNVIIMASPLSSAEEFDFVEEPSRDFFCPVTLDLLREPHQTLCCGNHISPEAVATLQKSGKPCPLCKKDDLKTVPDKFFKRKVNELKVRCPHKSTGSSPIERPMAIHFLFRSVLIGGIPQAPAAYEVDAAGCLWVGELGDRERHLSIGSAEGRCKFVEVACTYSCGLILQRRNLAVHKARQCPNRPFKCQYCGHDATHSEITTLHYSQCEKFPIECPNKCGKKAIERRNVPSHRQRCPLDVIACEFRHAGCTAKLPRTKMADHKRQSVEEHLTMAGKTIEQQAIVLQQQATMLQKHTKTIASLQQQAETTATLVKQLVAHLKPESIAESPSVVFIPPPAIIMTNFSQHMCAGDIWFSPPFYSHIGGYKMCLRVDANGWGDGEGTHVSVFVTLLRGEHDDDLLWPFRGYITLQLCNCREDTGHLDSTLSFDDCLGDDVSGRVTEGEQAASGFGQPHFTPHTALCYNASKNTEFLVNDTLKFRVTALKLTNLVL